ncbi:hypothetical protein CLPU_3c01210 [Gottschalkia purinilytica]|uniref:Uncharacterized protein n=1 Tax=Gottschalkia purinilytica TaxID=1503 RepID=A0A0L0WCZ7_GOTPU|nr:hemolysin family protein [Gottschalkia purinilytica]KNF09343.1 hypothetical protein CLPU_3c01210 [Gottschalkia purinilytica]
MPIDVYVKGIVLIILLVLSAIFSGSETAITSITASQISKLREENEEQAEKLKKIKKKIGDILATILMGNNIVNIAATSILTELSIEILGPKSSTLITTVVMTILILVFGEITPKSYAAQNTTKVAVRVAGLLEVLAYIFKPVLFVLTKVTNFIVRLLGGNVGTTNAFVTEEDIRSLVDVGEEEGVLEHEEKEMIQNIFEINDKEVTEVMVPRIDIVAVSEDSDIKEALDIIITYGHSRIPVFKETIDNIVGILYAKDLLPHSFSNIEKLQEKTIASIMRTAYYIPETKKINQLLKELQQSQVHIAIVLDEYGGTEGLVTIEDILEEIVGDIFDEYDNEIDLIEKIDDNSYIVQSEVSLEEINELLELDLPEEDFDSLGGFIFSTLGRVPIQGDIVKYEDITMKVIKVQNRRIKSIEIKRTVI